MSAEHWNAPRNAPRSGPRNAPPRGPVRLKICGLRTIEDVHAAVEAGCDAIGLVLVEGSLRHVSDETAALLAEAAADRVALITLMVNPNEQQVRSRQTDWIQLHGSEAAGLVQIAASTGPVVRAVAFDDTNAITQWDQDPNVARLLIDGHRGGSGIAFDHAAFAEVAATITTPWILAGGLTPETVGPAIECLQPWGVDVSSGVESKPGVKDAGRIAAFCNAARAASL